jgi:antitoxin component of RelBE/YafQ-DinJ toxin-antitoxin module
MWLKMLGNKESAQRAFQQIEQLSPERREKNDTIRAGLKYCVYLKDLPVDSLSEEEQDFMKTMAEIDAWYDAEMDKAERKGEERGKLEGKLEFATRAMGMKFQGYTPTENVTSQLASLNEGKLDDFVVGLFNWQMVAQMEEWLQENKHKA